ncbi:MAG: SDR family oxidoreductase [Candidatus Hydrogenedentota bacterium]|nr:MAG: SDR family oxidoreductase [Candidatus Hydrogenedentota bacterium]
MGRFSVAGKTVLVTGAAKRLGRAFALDFASRGAHLAVHYRSSRKEAEIVVHEIVGKGGVAKAFRADLRVREEVEKMAEEVISWSAPRGLAAVVASASRFHKTPWETLSEQDWEEMIETNLTAVFRLARLFAPALVTNGSFITIGDWAAERPYRGFLPYCVSKAGVAALTKALAVELAPGIRANAVCPGTVLPPDSAKPEVIERIRGRTPLGRIGSPEDVAAAVRFLVEETDFATGTCLVIDGGRLVSDPGYG